MKLNWGKSIVLAMVLFIGFIMFMVVSMITQPEYDHDLVVEEYYKKEMTLNDKLEKINNGRAFEANIKFEANQNGLLLTFQEPLKDLKNAEIFGYRASDKNLDFKTAVSPNQNGEALVQRNLISGPWEFTLAFSLGEKEYLVKKVLSVE